MFNRGKNFFWGIWGKKKRKNFFWGTEVRNLPCMKLILIKSPALPHNSTKKYDLKTNLKQKKITFEIIGDKTFFFWQAECNYQYPDWTKKLYLDYEMCYEARNILVIRKCKANVNEGRRDSRAGRALALHTTDPVLILGTTFGPKSRQ